MEPLKGASLGLDSSLTHKHYNNEKDLSGTSTLDYFVHSYIIAIKYYITLGPGLIFVVKYRCVPKSGTPEYFFHSLVGSGKY